MKLPGTLGLPARLMIFVFAFCPLASGFAQSAKENLEVYGLWGLAVTGQAIKQSQEEEAAQAQRDQVLQAAQAKERQEKDDALFKQQQEAADRAAAQQKADADAQAAKDQAEAAAKVQQQLAANRSALDQNLGGFSLQLGPGQAASPPSAAPVPAAMPVPNPPPSTPDAAPASADPVLAARLHQVGDYVRAGNFAAARKLAESCAILFPDDPGPKVALEHIAALEPDTARPDQAAEK